MAAQCLTYFCTADSRTRKMQMESKINEETSFWNHFPSSDRRGRERGGGGEGGEAMHNLVHEVMILIM